MEDISKCKYEITETLQNYVIPFWLERSVDKEYGGFITSFDQNGNFDGNGVKNIVTQSRMVWGFSYLKDFAKEEDKKEMQEAAQQGAEYLITKFWDQEKGGLYWLLNRDGSIADPSKLTYGEGFGVYALAQYYLTYGDKTALSFAEETFDLLQKYATDTLRGGYFENIERDWSISPAGSYAGDRKSLDIHMHLLEAWTTLYEATGDEIHKRKLQEVWDIIKTYMVNTESGYGLNQFDLWFHQLPAINIMRTWNAEREKNETITIPTNTTSYGHNVELSWLADHALNILGERKSEDNELLIKFLDHALLHGYDHENGGLFRDGVENGDALVLDKEWWQNFEALTGFLNGYLLTKDEKYLEVFIKQWKFVKTHFMNYEVGESRQLLNRKGEPLVSNIGNPWKGIYHTGRALAECITRLNTLQEK